MVEQFEKREKRVQSIKELWNKIETQQNNPITILETFIKEDVRTYYQFTEEMEQNNPKISMHKVIHRNLNQELLVKTIPKSEECQKLLKEFEALKKMDHPNIVKVVQQYEDENFYHIVMENPKGMELFNLIEQESQITEQKASIVIDQLLKAIKYSHLIGISHRDIKPEKIIIVDENDLLIKLIGWEFCDLFAKGEGMETPVGTLNYLAPEIFSGCYGPEIDCWSIGVIMYVLLSGFYPFENNQIADVIKYTLQVSFEFPEWDSISSEAKDLISKLLSPSNRIQASEALKHQWFQKFNVQYPLNKPLMQTFQNFTFKNKLQLQCLEHIGHYSLDSETQSQIQKLFYAIDIQNNGFLTFERYQQACENLNLNQSEIQKQFSQLDLERYNQINFSSFRAACVDTFKINDVQLLWRVFKFFDIVSYFTLQKETNKYTPEDIKKIINYEFRQISVEETKNIVKDFGIAGEKRAIKFQDFTNMLVNQSYEDLEAPTYLKVK